MASSSDRPGTYRVVGEHPDYQTGEAVVVVAGDDCDYAVQRDVTVELTPR